MSASLSRGATFLRRASVPASAFGAGYGCSWAQGREESTAQLLTCGAVGSWAGVTRSLRLLGSALPEGAQWPREKLAQVSSRELRSLADVVEAAAVRGLDSKPLWRLELQRLCEIAEVAPRGEGAAGLAADGGPGAALPALAARLGRASAGLSSALGGAPEVALLPHLAGALQAVVAAGGPKWHEELGPDGVLGVARAAAVASAWLAGSLRERQLHGDGASAALAVQAEEASVRSLAAVWQALGQVPSGARPGQRPAKARGAEALAAYKDLEAKYAALQVTPPAPPTAATRPLQDALPPRVRRPMAVALRGGWGGGGAAAAAAAAEAAPCPVAPAGSEAPPCGEGVPPAEAVPEGAQAKLEDAAREAPVARSPWWAGTFQQAGRATEIGAWVVLIAAAAVAISEDGFGCFQFHTVPSAWRGPVADAIQRRAVLVEDLLAKYESPAMDGHQEHLQVAPYFSGEGGGGGGSPL